MKRGNTCDAGENFDFLALLHLFFTLFCYILYNINQPKFVEPICAENVEKSSEDRNDDISFN